jgi:polyisoprenoid-binding protein YceI
MNARSRSLHSIGILLAFAATTVGLADSDTTQPVETEAMAFAPISEDALELVVPENAAERGVTYYALPGRAVQATFTSTTPIETFTGESDAIIGFAIVERPAELAQTLSVEGESGPAERGALLEAEFAVPVRSIRTGIDMRDRHLRTAQWLDESRFPYIRYRLAFFADPVDATPDGSPDGAHTFTGELVGDMTIRGVTRPLRIENARIALLPESEATRRVSPGDLMALRCRYTLTLPDFGIDNAIVGRQVATEIEVDQVIYLSTVGPSEQAAAQSESESDSESNGSGPEDPSSDER